MTRSSTKAPAQKPAPGRSATAQPVADVPSAVPTPARKPPPARQPSSSKPSFDALLGAQFDKISEVTPAEVPLERIRFVPQPRRHFDEQALAHLAQSVRTHGVLQPILLRREGTDYLLIAGERRTRAARLAGLERIPARILAVSAEEARAIALVENLSRSDLNPLEETEAVLSLLEARYAEDRRSVLDRLRRRRDLERGRVGNNVMSALEVEDLDEFFSALGRFAAGSFFVNRVPLLKMPESLKEAVLSGRLEYTKATLLSKVRDPAERDALLARTLLENLSVAQLRRARLHEPPSPPPPADLHAFTQTLEPRLASLDRRTRRKADRLLEALRTLLGP